MSTTTTYSAVSIFSAAVMVVGSDGVSGQTYPTKPIRFIVSAPGGSNDFTARLIAPGLASSLGQPVIVENRPSGIIPQETVAKASPDGYTLMVQGASLWIVTLLQKMSYDPVRDFSPISLVSTSPNILVVHPSVAANSAKELIALAKARPGELNYASSAAGTSTHLSAELFKAIAGVNIVRIPYKGSGGAFAGLTSGEVQVLFASVPSVMPHMKSGRLRALAVTSGAPSALLPGLPTVAATGLPGYKFESVDAIYTTAKTPAPIINRLNQEILRVLSSPEVKERFLSVGVEPVGSSPREVTAVMKSEMAVLGKVIKDAGIRAD